MNFKQDDPELLKLVADAHKGYCVLPEFQRSFVWEYTNVVDFLNSIFKGLYIGSFLAQACDSESTPFAFRPIEGVNLTNDSCEPKYMLLDGQQRVTTLHYVFYAPEDLCLKDTSYPYKFYLRMDYLQDEDLKDKAIWGLRIKDAAKWDGQEFQFENRVIPFTLLRSSQTWTQWLDAYQLWLAEKDGTLKEVRDFTINKKLVWTKTVGNLLYKTIPVVELDEIDPDNQDQIAEVCAIFEKINSSGVRLSIFELLTARLYKYKINLRTLWEESIGNFALLKEYSEGETGQYGIFILRIICLIRGLEATKREIIGLKAENFSEDWVIASTYLEEALKKVNSTSEGGFGAFIEYWIPYPPMLVTLAALLYQIDKLKIDHRGYKIIRKWYWGNVFDERYQSGIESKTTADYKALLENFTNPESSIPLFDEFDQGIVNNPSYTLFGESRVNAVYKGVMCLLALNGAMDFRTQIDISLHTLDDHHVFPKAYLDDEIPALKDLDKNVILNRTLIRDTTNRKIGKLAPSVYLKKEDIIEQSNKAEILKRHFINEEALEALQNNDFEAFKRVRNYLILEKIRSMLKI